MAATSDTTGFSYSTPAGPDTADLTGATSSNSQGSLFSATTSGLQTLDIVLTNILSDNKKIAFEPYNNQFTLSDGTTGYSALHYATLVKVTGLNYLDDVNITSAADGSMLLYDTGTAKWIDNVMSGDATMLDTGAITLTDGNSTRTNLGLAIGSDVQAHDSDLDTLAGLSKADNNFIVGSGSAWVVESGTTVRTSLGLGATAVTGVDDATIEINSSNLRVKADGINDTHIDFGTGTNQVSSADVPEQTNLYYTDARARASVSATDGGGDGSFAYNSSTGVFTYTGPSASEVRAHLSAGTGLTYNSGAFAIDGSVVTESSTDTLTNKTLTEPTLTSPVLNIGVSGTAIKDEDNMSSNSATHLATQQSIKAYVDSVAEGLDVKNSVKVTTTANITLANTQTIDGVSLSAGDRVLVKDQSTGSQNGVYVVVNGGSWTRATDFDSNTEVTDGTFFFVEQGTLYADSGWVLTTNNPITVGSTALVFSQFSGAGQITAGDGLTKSGNTINVVGTADKITVSADAITIASTYAGQSSINTLGTIGTGTWQGTAIADTYVANDLTISGGTVNNSAIGASTPSSGAFTTLSANGDVIFTGANQNLVWDKSDDQLEFNQAKIYMGSGLEIKNIGPTYIRNISNSSSMNIENHSDDQDIIFRATQSGYNLTSYIHLDSSEGEVKLYHQSSHNSDLKLATKSTGVDVTGVLTTDGATHDGDVTFTGDNHNVVWDKSANQLEFANEAKAEFGGGTDIFVNSYGNTIFNITGGGNATGDLYLQNLNDNKSIFIRSDNGSGSVVDYVKADGSTGEVILSYYGAEKLATKSTGVDVTGGVSVNNGSTSAGYIEFFEDSDNGTNKATLIGPSSTSDVTLTLPNSTGTVMVRDSNGVVKGGSSLGEMELQGSNPRLRLVDADAAASSFQIFNTASGGDTYVIEVDNGDGVNNSSLQIQVDDENIASFSTSGLLLHTNNDSLIFEGSSYNTTLSNAAPSANRTITLPNADGTVALTSDISGYAPLAGATFTGDVTFTGANYNVVWDKSQDSLEFADNARATFGTGRDLQFYHNGTNSILENYTGDMYIQNFADGKDIIIRSDNGSGGDTEYIKCDGSNGQTELFHYGTKKLHTQSSGVRMIGNVVVTGGQLELGPGNDTTLTRVSGGVIAVEGNTVITTGNSDTPTTTTSSGDADFVLVDDGGTMKKITPANLGIGGGGGALTGTGLTLTSTDAGSADGPTITLKRDSASPGNFDDIGEIEFLGENSASEEIRYGHIKTQITSPIDGAEESRMVFSIFNDGADKEMMFLDAHQGGGVVYLTAGIDLLFEGPDSSKETTLTVEMPTADRTITLPDATGTVSLLTATETLTNKTLTTPVINGFTGTGNGTITDGTVNITGATGTAQLQVNLTDTTTYNHSIKCYNTHMTQGQYNQIHLGESGSSYNTGVIAYRWDSAGSAANNYLEIGHWANGDLIKVYGDKVEITDPLTVTGATTLSSTVRSVGNFDVNTDKFTVNASTGNTTIAGTTTLNNDVTFTGANYNVVWDKSDDALEFADNAKLTFGAGNDLQIYHDGSHSYISDQGTGGITVLNDSWMYFRSADASQIKAIFKTGGGVDLYHSNSKKFETTAAGVTVTGAITATGDITAFSDERLKSDIETIDNALDKVMNMRGVSYTKQNAKGIGVIAQEVEKVIPEVVHDGEYKSVAYGNMVGILIEAIKEQQKQIDELKKLMG